MAKATIPNIHCDCGKTIRAWGYVKKGLRVVTCQCGRRWTLAKAGETIRIQSARE